MWTGAGPPLYAGGRDDQPGDAVRYVSTRGDAPVLSFGEALLAGLASDGGLYVPTETPKLTDASLKALATLRYPQVCARVLAPFAEGSLTEDELAELAHGAYETFSHPAVAPVTPLFDQPAQPESQPADAAWPTHLVELYHGPTFSFKDVALQLLGRLFEHELHRRGATLTIVGATSGDTGSAAIEACRDRDGIQLVMLHPAGMVTEVQRRQMTTVTSANIHNIAIDGTFDDCQDIVKALMGDAELRAKLNLGAVNSINPARVLAQAVYYVTSALALGAPERSVSFCVPTGNFGNVLAGDLARRMGVPIGQLVIATNHNDILARTHATGVMELRPVVPSSSPAMDIAVSSNFERLLFELHERDARRTAAAMTGFRETDTMPLDDAVLARFRSGFKAGSASEHDVTRTIGALAERGRLVDPHTAVGIHVASQGASQRGRSGALSDAGPVAVMATAHPAKFADTVEAATGAPVALPPPLAATLTAHERCEHLPADAQAVKEFVVAAVS